MRATSMLLTGWLVLAMACSSGGSNDDAGVDTRADVTHPDGTGDADVPPIPDDALRPLGEIAEVRFAADNLSKPEESNSDRIIVRLDPVGNITGKPLSGDTNSLKLLTPYAGEINLKLDSAIILDFQPSNNFLDDWDPQF